MGLLERFHKSDLILEIEAGVVGGEEVRLQIQCCAHNDLFGPIIGFYCNDRLGQPLFGDNTFNFSCRQPLIVAQEQRFEATFDFFMPILPTGEYTFTVALAEGTQQDHVQHHWIHEALILKSHSSSVSTGLVGIPMHTV
ncbi:MAG: ABC transporter ATP-binding protein, partial [Syntrophobacteraceae bacterium]|nr:ABC transporter ATP-binding protein [Syntrophobacteraceae bacterium]